MVVDGNENDDDDALKPKKQIDQKALNRLQAMAMSDDDDYGKAAFEQLWFLFHLPFHTLAIFRVRSQLLLWAAG